MGALGGCFPPLFTRAHELLRIDDTQGDRGSGYELCGRVDWGNFTEHFSGKNYRLTIEVTVIAASSAHFLSLPSIFSCEMNTSDVDHWLISIASTQVVPGLLNGGMLVVCCMCISV